MNTPHTPQEAIRTPYPTRTVRLQQARALLEAAIARYMQREGDDRSLSGPLSLREKVESAIFEVCESLSGYADVREVLYLARLYHASRAEGVILCPGSPACLVQPLPGSRKDGQV
jgi:hypothetical protein